MVDTLPLTLSTADHRDKFIGRQALRTTTGDNRQLVVLSGVVTMEIPGRSENDWHRGTVTLQVAIGSDTIPARKLFRAEDSVVSVWPSSVEEGRQTSTSGFAVDKAEIRPPAEGASRVVEIVAEVAVKNPNVRLLRLGYHVTVVGTLVDDPNE